MDLYPEFCYVFARMPVQASRTRDHGLLGGDGMGSGLRLVERERLEEVRECVFCLDCMSFLSSILYDSAGSSPFSVFATTRSCLITYIDTSTYGYIPDRAHLRTAAHIQGHDDPCMDAFVSMYWV